jgi:Tol biopolymer transport system component
MHIYRCMGITLALLALTTIPALAASTERVSVASDGTQGDADSQMARVTSDGRYVALWSEASNLVPGDTNGVADIFVHDRQTGTTERVSVASDGTEGDSVSIFPSVSSDGRYIAFGSYASNLVPDDTNGVADIFVHDRQTGTTERVSVASDGTQGNDEGFRARISADGSCVAFISKASNLVPSDTNGWSDIFVHVRQTGTTERVSVASDGTQGNVYSDEPSISSDGRYIAFLSSANNLVDADTNAALDVFVHDRQTGTTERVSVATDGTEGNGGVSYPSLSPDGRYAAFSSYATNLVPDDMNGDSDLFLHDRQTGTTERVSVAGDGGEADADSWTSSISGDGRYVAFDSSASNLVAGDTNGHMDIFLRDRQTGTTERLSVASDGTQGTLYSDYPVITSDAQYVVFVSDAPNLVAGDTNYVLDIFVRVREVTAIFPDVPLDHWANEEVENCFGAGIVAGYDDGLYQPEWPVARDQMAVYVSRALADGDENVPDFTGTPTFLDVDAEQWALDHIEYAVDQNVVAGYGDGTYHPEYEVTRDQMAVYVARAMVAPSGEAALADYVPSAPRNFPDVPNTGYGDDGTEPFWAYTHVEYCVEHSVVAGYDDGMYHPEWVVTRDQMAVYIARAFGLL